MQLRRLRAGPLRAGLLIDGVLLALSAGPAAGAAAVACSEPAAFYETSGYLVRTVKIESPFRFLSVVRKRLEAIQKQLPLLEGDKFTLTAFAASHKQLDSDVTSDSVFGSSQAKFVYVSDNIQDCDAAHKTVDIAYHVYSTDPILAATNPGDTSAAKTAESNTNSTWKLEPLFGYNRTLRGFGGGDLAVRIPGGIVQDLHVSGFGSSASRAIDAEVDGSRSMKASALDRLEYHLGYHYSDAPALALQLSKALGDFRVTGTSRPVDTAVGRFAFRYGASIEAGNQHSGRTGGAMPADVLASSGYGALRFYTGLTHSTRYSSTAVSYGLQRGGPGLGHLSFTKQVGDVVYGLRFPGSSHRPFDFQVRATGGGISTSSPMPLTDRFFGGNLVAPFIPGDSWLIPEGPLVRSVPANRLAGQGFGGTSFYSGNLTVGKVMVRSPLIPDSIGSDTGFLNALNAAQDTGQSSFANDYESSSEEYKKVAAEGAATITLDLNALQPALIGVTVNVTAVRGLVRRSLLMAGHVTTPDKQGQVHTSDIKALLRLVNQTTVELAKAAAGSGGARLTASQTKLEDDARQVSAKLDEIHNGAVGQAAMERARRDMERPRAAVDALRREVNAYAVGLVGIFDAGRLLPDPNGVRYAIGGGIRFSVASLNLTFGYAWNPNPVRVLKEGPGAVLMQLTYTDLFR